MDLDLSDIGHCHRCMVLLGLMPCSRRHHQQIVQKFYTIILLLVIIAFSIYGISTGDSRNGHKTDLAISLSVMCMHFISQICALTMVFCEMITSYNQHVDFINNTRQIYNKFYQKTGYRICSGAFGAYLHRKYGCVAFVVGGSIVVYMMIVICNYYYGFFWFALPSVVILRTRFMQIALYVDIMLKYLDVLNKQLQHILIIKKHKSLIFMQIDTSVEESLQRLLILKDIYTDIANSVQLFNDIFGWSIISVVVCTYLGITIHTYWAIMSLDGFYAIHFFYLCICVLVPLWLVMIIFCYNCEKLRSSHNLTTSLVKQLIGINGSAYNAVVCEFSMQIDSRPLHITAKGFFTANMGLLMALGAYIVSMLVILVQFSLVEFKRRGQLYG